MVMYVIKTHINSELITDPKILNMFERSKRGGLTFVGSKRYVKANNRDMVGYDPTTKSTYLLYLDANTSTAGVRFKPYLIRISNSTQR